jgi:hypothetical protein
MYSDKKIDELKKQPLTMENVVSKLPKYYIVSAMGWYYSSNIIDIFPTKEEALDFISCTEEEYNKQLSEQRWSEGFWHFEIKEIDLFDLLLKHDNLIKEETNHETVKKILNAIEKGNIY